MKKICVKLGALLMAALLTMGLVSGAFAAYGFDDVPEDAWYADAVCRVSQMGYMNGVGGQRFAPKAPMTRAMFVTSLYRMAARWTGLPAETPAADFSDVPATAWYAKPVAWAASQGIVAGRRDGRFDPKAPISRQEMAVMLLRFAQAVRPELVTDDNIIERIFTDMEQVSPYAEAAVWFCAHRGFFAGDAAGRCLPKKTATRAEAAQVLMVLEWQIVPIPANGRAVLINMKDDSETLLSAETTAALSKLLAWDRWESTINEDLEYEPAYCLWMKDHSYFFPAQETHFNGFCFMGSIIVGICRGNAEDMAAIYTLLESER